MNDKQKIYILKNWQTYNLVNSQEEMRKLLNILEAHGENLDTLHDATNEFCGIYGAFSCDRDVVQALFDFNCFYNNKEEMEKACQENAEGSGMTLAEYMEYEDIRNTSDGLVRVLYY